MKDNIFLTKSMILIHLDNISSEFLMLSNELKDLNPDSVFYQRLVNSKLLALKKYVDMTTNELRQIDIKQVSNDHKITQ